VARWREENPLDVEHVIRRIRALDRVEEAR
jgi:hypothetical protein